jgi:SNF2 family DNA or RNA helicase
LRRLLHPFILRRTKDQVASELPAKVEQMHYCEMTDEQREFYERTKNAYRNYLFGLGEDEFKKKKFNILAGLQKLRQIAIHPALVEGDDEVDVETAGSGKYEEFQRLLAEVVEKGAKVLVFSQFVRVLTMLRKDLDEQGLKYCYLDGATRDRQAQVKIFQEDPTVTAFLISLKAGGVGLNLTAAEYVFILDPWWNPAVEAQAIDRSHRIGQTKTVFSYKFITRDSIEEKIVRLQERKKNLSNEMVNAEEGVFKQLNLDDLKELLE